jgi:hypothetical protein
MKLFFVLGGRHGTNGSALAVQLCWRLVGAAEVVDHLKHALAMPSDHRLSERKLTRIGELGRSLG